MKQKDLEREEYGNIARIGQQIHDAAMEKNVYEVRARAYMLQQAVKRLEVILDLIKTGKDGA